MKTIFPDADVSMEEVVKFVQDCAKCQRLRTRKSFLPYPQKHSLPVSLGHRLVAMDTTQLPPDKDGNKYIIIIVDRLTKLVFAMPAKDKGSLECSDALLTFASLYYTPDEVRVDTDSQLMAKDFQLMA